jgi:hypothetical protein
VSSLLSEVIHSQRKFEVETIIFSHSERKEGQKTPDFICFSSHKPSLERFKAEHPEIKFSYPDCEVMCEKNVQTWMILSQENGVFVPNEQELKLIKENMHFYKEIILF